MTPGKPPTSTSAPAAPTSLRCAKHPRNQAHCGHPLGGRCGLIGWLSGSAKAHSRLSGESSNPRSTARWRSSRPGPSTGITQNFIRRFDAEAHSVTRLEHPHIVPSHAYWREPGSAHLVTRSRSAGSHPILELAHPMRLQRLHHRRRQLQPPNTLRICAPCKYLPEGSASCGPSRLRRRRPLQSGRERKPCR
jgi:hypothetical protein